MQQWKASHIVHIVRMQVDRCTMVYVTQEAALKYES